MCYGVDSPFVDTTRAFLRELKGEIEKEAEEGVVER